MAESNKEELNQREIELVRSSWKVFMQNPEENGVALFKKFLYKYDYFPLFKKFEGVPRDKLPEEKVFRNHSLAIVRGVDNLIINLDSPSKLKESINAIVEKHKGRNIRDQQFDELKGTILESLVEFFHLPEESLAAWNKTLGIAFSDIVKNIFS